MKKKFLLSIIFLVKLSVLIAQPPAGYYDNAEGKTGIELQQTLHNIIKDHYSQSYSSLHTHYHETDKKANGKVWDMYSDVPDGTPPYEFNFGNTCGNYSGENDCYNREHSWPSSWFNKDYPMYSDLFHVVPSDGYVNGRRSSYPYGEVGNPTYTSQNGCKLGPCIYQGYSGTVFEPIDAYKGDFARIYFYMSTRYYNQDAGWQNNGMVDGSQLKPWALEMMLEWHQNDPVSQKEIDRNNAVYSIQGNRNPFVDFPDYALYIWDDEIPTDAIKIVSTPDTIIFIAYEYVYYVKAADSTEAITFTVEQLPAWLQLKTISNGTAKIYGTPSQTDYGQYQIDITAKNNDKEARQNYILEVKKYNEPEFISSPITIAIENYAYTYSIEGYSSLNALTFTTSELPSWLTLTQTSNTEAKLSGTPTNLTQSDFPITITIDDGINKTEQSYTLQVMLANGQVGIEKVKQTFSYNYLIVDNQIKLNYELNQTSDIQINLTTILGVKNYSNTIKKQKPGNYTQNILLKNNQQFYILQFIVKNQIFCEKIIIAN